MNRLLTMTLFLVGALCLVFAGVLWWLDATLLDADRFEEETVAALKTPAAREFVAAEVWSEMRRELPPVRILDRGTAEAVIADFLVRPGLDPLFRRSAGLLYASVMAPGSGPVTFDLGEEYPLVVESLLGIDAELVTDFVPLDRLGAIVLVEEGQLPDLSPVEKTSGWAFPLLLAGGALLIVLGLWVGRRRTWTLSLLGAALAFAALVQRAALPWVEDLLIEPVADPQVALVMRDVLEGVKPSLLEQSSLLLYLGMGMVAVNALIAGGWRLGRRGSRPS